MRHQSIIVTHGARLVPTTHLTPPSVMGKRNDVNPFSDRTGSLGLRPLQCNVRVHLQCPCMDITAWGVISRRGSPVISPSPLGVSFLPPEADCTAAC